MLSPLWFAVVYLALSAARPEYSHLTKAISELGSVDAPRAWVWNIFGYIISPLVRRASGARDREPLCDATRRSPHVRLAHRFRPFHDVVRALSGRFR
jgi:hypothetical protein